MLDNLLLVSLLVSYFVLLYGIHALFPSYHKISSTMKTFLFFFTLVLSIMNSHAQWVPTNGPFGGRTNHYASNDEAWFAGTIYGGLFVSENNGASWQKRNNGFANLGSSGLNVTALYADDEIAYIGIGGNGFYRSYDNGMNWEPMTTFWSSYVLNKIVRKGDHIFVGTGGSGLQRSTDNGATWQLSMSGVIPALTHTVNALIVKDEYVFVVINSNLYRSDDNGEEWDLLSSGLPQNTYDVNLCGNVLVATTGQGMFRSINNGDLWNMSNTGIDIPSVFFLKATSHGDEIYVGDQYYSIFYSSNDFGLTWTPIDYPFENAMYSIYALGDSRLLFQTDIQSSFSVSEEPSGLYLTENAGLTWSNITNEIDGTFCMSLVAVNDDLYCSTLGNAICKSSNGGDNWVQVGIPNWQARVIRNLNGKIFAGGSNGIYYSSDNGATWAWGNQGLTNASINDFAHIEDDFFAATADGVFISTDGGESWSSQNTGITTFNVTSLFVDGTTIYAGTANGVFISTNFGNSWSEFGTGIPEYSSVNSIVKQYDNLLVSSSQGIYLLQSGGTVWELVSEGSLANDAYRLEVIGDKIFACRMAPVVNYDGVFVSFDGGNTWEGHSQGLTNNQVWDIEVMGDVVYCATLGSGCFKRNLSEFVALSVEQKLSIDFLVYPNPANDQLVVQSESNIMGEQLSIFNAMGQVMERVIRMSNGKAIIDVSAYPSGYYFARVGASTQKFFVHR